MSSLSGRMNIARVNIGFFTGFKKIKQRRISFLLTKTTQKGGFNKLWAKINKRCYTDLLPFSTRKHNLVYFFRPNRILTVELHGSFLYIVFVFRRKRRKYVMKSIKTNPNSAKGPDKGKIVNKLHCILLITLELF
jgi:hypothetical protein